MKTIKSFFFTSLFAVLIIGSFSCERDEEAKPDNAETVLTDEEIVDLVTNSMEVHTEGLAASVESIATTASAIDEKSLTALTCGETHDTSGRREFESSYLTAAYTNSLTATLNCNDRNIPESLEYQRSTNGMYETTRLLSNDGTTTDWELSEILLGPNYVVNGAYSRTGTQTSKVREQRAFESTIVFTIDNLLIDKGEREIRGGSASVELSVKVNGEAQGGQNLDLIFLGNGEANLIINGNVYPITLP